MKPKNTNLGFTLVELLISMTLLALILTILFGGLRMSSKVWDAAEKNSVANTHLVSLQNFLHKQFAQIIPYKVNQQRDKNIVFIGEHNRIHMIARMASRHDPGGLYLISIAIEEGETGHELILRRVVSNPHFIDFKTLQNAEKLVLAENVDQLKFEYYGSGSKTGQARWMPAWTVQTRLPLLIRMHLNSTNDRKWPVLVVAPIIGKNTGCTWDVAENRCMGV
jgi:prepilin-type N-terminal cleavage/methylation domain-containing protein